MVHESLRAGYLEGDFSLHLERWACAGSRSFRPSEINGSVYNFSLPGLIAGTKSTQFVNAPPGLTYPGDPGFIGKTGEQKQWNLFAPRVALAWDPKGDGKMVIRAGWGISYDYVAGELMVNSADAPPYGGTEIWSGQFSNPFATNPGGNIYPYTPNKNCAVCSGRNVHLCSTQLEDSLERTNGTW